MASAATSSRRVIVSGGSRGIGRAVALAFAREGAAVGLLARTPSRLETTAAELGAAGASLVATVAADTTHADEVAAAVAELVDRLDGVDALVNTAALPAGTVQERPIQDYDESQLRIELETKVLGYLRTAKAVAPAFIAQQHGRIVNVAGQSLHHTGSISATVRNAAVTALTKNLADELGPHGVTANVIHPGFTVTDDAEQRIAGIAGRRGISAEQAAEEIAARSSIRSLATADEVAELVRFLASDAGRTINGESISVGGGTAGFIFQY